MFCDTLKMDKLVSAGGRSGVTHKDNLLVTISAWMLNHASSCCRGPAMSHEEATFL